ncbi:carbohydrate esterase family 16 protein [Daedalea quercina L-15889]|uniref:Carbohydrate esterase family 16 protein n=1 Tax=Daedalea quercina L-15889 TaxID=1314783 RepID=A0A165TYL1_9APHY|nr:carbohydrate esterase family 16 protein [Daedalea quercina L-15889]
MLAVDPNVEVYATYGAKVADDLPQQVEEFVRDAPQEGLHSENTLYVFWMGIYDCISAHGEEEELRGLVGMLLDDVKHLYEKGARNFLVIDVPATDRAPVLFPQDSPGQLERYIQFWNELLREGASRFAEDFTDASIFVFSSNKMMCDLLDDAEEFGFKEGEERNHIVG